MDNNTAAVLLCALVLASTLGGLWLGMRNPRCRHCGKRIRD